MSAHSMGDPTAWARSIIDSISYMVPISTGQGVYMRALATQVADAELEPALEVCSARSREQGGMDITRDLVSGDSDLRLFRAVAFEYSMLAKDGQSDHRVTVDVAR